MQTLKQANISCYRCKGEITGEFKVVRDKFLGPSCFALYQRRNRIRAAVPSKEQTSPGFVQTDICKTDCIDCMYFNLPKCPQEEAFKGTLGRRR
jgi:hypothetical protein